MPNLAPVAASLFLDPEDAAQLLVGLLATREERENLAVIDGRIARCLESASYYRKLRGLLAERLLHAHLGCVNFVDRLDSHHQVGTDPMPEVTALFLIGDRR